MYNMYIYNNTHNMTIYIYCRYTLKKHNFTLTYILKFTKYVYKQYNMLVIFKDESNLGITSI